jgi:sec-independent protein translocase protein TatA
MLRGLFEGPAPWIILAVVILLFGATRLPALARSLGQSAKIFRTEVKDAKDEKAAETKSDDASASTTTTSEATTPADGTSAK